MRPPDEPDLKPGIGKIGNDTDHQQTGQRITKIVDHPAILVPDHFYEYHQDQLRDRRMEHIDPIRDLAKRHEELVLEVEYRILQHSRQQHIAKKYAADKMVEE